MIVIWPFDPTVVGGLAAASLGYAWVARRMGAGLGRALSFASGLLVVWLALETPLDPIADRFLQSAHMAQHMLLMTVAPPLLLVGLSAPMAAFVLRLPGLRRLVEPVPALIVYATVMIGWHLPPVFDLALRDPLVHIGGHLAFLGAGILFWWPVIRSTGVHARWRLDEPQIIVYLLAGMLPMMAVSLPLQFSRELFYPYYGSAPRLVPGITPIIDQSIAGAVMMLMEMVATGIEAVIVICRWLGDAVGADLQHQEEKLPSRGERPVIG